MCETVCALCVKNSHLGSCVLLLNICLMYYSMCLYTAPLTLAYFSIVVFGSDSEERPLKGSSLGSLNVGDMNGDSISRDSLVDYTEGGREFNEDGSFIGEYCGRMHRGSVSEPSGPTPVTA